jgi:hypothetical protein
MLKHGLIRVQIELQQRGVWWYIKGCTAYAEDNIHSLPIADEPYPSHRAAILMMKQMAREELVPAELTPRRRLLWQFVLWPPQNAVRSPRQTETQSTTTSYLMENALPAV